MSSPSSLIPPPPAAYMPSKHAGGAHDEENGSHATRHENHNQHSPSHNPLNANESFTMSLPSRISVFPSQEVVTLNVSGHNTIIQLLHRFGKVTDQVENELPLVEHRPYSVGSAPRPIEPRRPPIETSNHPPKTTETPTGTTPITCKKRAGKRNLKRMASPPNPVNQRREEIRGILKPLFSNAPFILICEGKEQDAVISAVRLSDALDPVSLWTRLSEAVWQCTRRWKRLLGPVRLELVNVRGFLMVSDMEPSDTN